MIYKMLHAEIGDKTYTFKEGGVFPDIGYEENMRVASIRYGSNDIVVYNINKVYVLVNRPSEGDNLILAMSDDPDELIERAKKNVLLMFFGGVDLGIVYDVARTYWHDSDARMLYKLATTAEGITKSLDKLRKELKRRNRL